MKYSIHVSVFLAALYLVATPVSWAQSTARVSRDQVPVYSDPSAKSEVLVTLSKNTTITIDEERSGWVKTKVKLDASFSFTGWVQRKELTFDRVISSSPRAKSKNVDQYFQPAAKAPPVQTSEPRFQPARQTSREIEPDSGPSKYHFKLGTGYRLYHYALKTGGATPAEVFAYNVPGIGIQLSGDYWYKTILNDKVQLGGKLDIEYVFMNHKTNLLDSTGTQFGNTTSKSTIYDVKATHRAQYRLPIMYPRLAALDIGAEWFQFNADDVDSDTGRTFLYVSQRFISFYGGPWMEFENPWVRNLKAELGLQIHFFSLVSESPSNSTGTDPSPGMGISGDIAFKYSFWGRHHARTGYGLRYQSVSYSGAGVRANSGITDGKATIASHNMFIGYGIDF